MGTASHIAFHNGTRVDFASQQLRRAAEIPLESYAATASTVCGDLKLASGTKDCEYNVSILPYNRTLTTPQLWSQGLVDSSGKVSRCCWRPVERR
jgi:hypothetical protein